VGSKPQTTNTATSTSPAAPAYQAYLGLLNQAQGVASTPYNPYTGELAAPINAQQQTGIGGINQFATAAQPYIAMAGQQAQASSAPLSQAAINQYLTPYLNNVVGATQAQFNNANQQQAQGVNANAVAQGAYGGNRVGVAQAELANQQQLAQAPVIAGLENTGYNNAVQYAMQQQQLGLQGANSLANIGTAGQTAGISGATAEFGAGTAEQNTQQLLDQLQLQQFNQAQAYPFQTTQWLAGLDTGVGSQMGGTGFGTTVAPGPTLASQIGGLGTGALGVAGLAGVFSDRRLKENIKHIGKLNDGQNIYRFNYKGDPTTHIGLMAQDVEKRKPDSVHEVGGYKAVDYKSATADAVKRSFGGVVGYAGGGAPQGVAGYPYAMAPGYVPNFSIAHGAGAPHVSPPSPAQQQQNPLTNQASQLGGLAKNILSGVNGQGQVFPGTDPTSDALNDFTQDQAAGEGAAIGDYLARGGVVGYARGGIAGFDDGGVASGDDDPFGDDNRAAGYDLLRQGQGIKAPDSIPGGEPAPSDVINPGAGNEYRMPPHEDYDQWRHGKDHPNPAIITDQSPQTGNPKFTASQIAKAQGVAPSASAFANEDASVDTSSMPSEVSLGYSKKPKAQGIVPPPPAPAAPEDTSWFHKPKVDLGADSKLWPALLSMGAGMMASRSPFFGQALGEGLGMAGTTYAAENKLQQEAQQHADQLALERERFERPYKEMTKAEAARTQQTAINEPVIMGPDGKPMVNPNYVQAQQDARKDFQPKFTKVDESEGGRDIMGWADPNTKKTYVNGQEYTPRNPAYAPGGPLNPFSPTAPTATPPAAAPPAVTPPPPPPAAPAPGQPGARPSPTAPGVPEASTIPPATPASLPSSPANASAPAPYQTASLTWVPPSHQQPSNAVPYDPKVAVPPATMDNPNTPTPPPPPPPLVSALHEADPTAPVGSDASRNTAFLARIAADDPGAAIAIKKAADYDLDASKYASMRQGHREKFMNNVFRYDPNWRPQEVGLIYKAQANFLPGTKTGDTVRSFNTAVAHLDTLRELYKVVNGTSSQSWNAIRNKFMTEFGYEPPNTLNGIAQIVGGEVVKATVGSQNALGDREELRKTLEPKLSAGQALDVIDNYQKLMGSQLHSLKFAYEQSTHQHNFDDKFLLPRSREVLAKVDAEMQNEGKSTSTTPTLTEFLDKAGKANPHMTKDQLTNKYNELYK
jgi:hypothetical protein